MIRETADAPLRQRNSFHVEEQAERLIEFDREEDLDLIFGKGRPERGTFWAEATTYYSPAALRARS